MSEITNNTNVQASNAYGRQSIQSLASALRKNMTAGVQANQTGNGTGSAAAKVTTGLDSEAATLQISNLGKDKAAAIGTEQQKQTDGAGSLSFESLDKIQRIAERIRRVSISASNGSADRNEMAKEFEGLRSDMDKLLEGTKFNSSNLGSEKTKLSELNLTTGAGNGEEAWISIDKAMDTLRTEAKPQDVFSAQRTAQKLPTPPPSQTVVKTDSAITTDTRIKDVDMAAEMEKFKALSLTQAKQTILAQANSTPQGVMSLLR